MIVFKDLLSWIREKVRKVWNRCRKLKQANSVCKSKVITIYNPKIHGPVYGSAWCKYFADEPILNVIYDDLRREIKIYTGWRVMKCTAKEKTKKACKYCPAGFTSI